MTTIDVVLDTAEESLAAGKTGEAYQSLLPVVGSLESSPGDRPTVATILRLANLLKRVAEKDDDLKEALNQAEYVFRKGIDWSPGAEGLALRNELGRVLYDKAHYDQAVKILIDLINAVPTPDRKILVRGLRLTGASLRELRSFDEAEECFVKALAMDPNPSARTLVEHGWLRLYQDEFERAAEDFQSALAKADAEESDKLEARAGLIAAYCAQPPDKSFGEPDKTTELITGWLSSPNPISEEAIQEALLESASVLKYLNKYEGALAVYSLLLQKNPDHEKAHELKMEALKWLRRFKEVDEAYRIAEKKFPDNVDIWLEMGHSLYQQKRFQEALDFFSGAAIERRTFSSPEAKQAFAEKLQNSKLANEWTIVLLRKMRRLPEAQQKVQEAMKRFPGEIVFLSEQAAIYFSNDEHDRAIRVFDRVLKIEAYDEFALRWRAASYRKLGEFKKAEWLVHEALEKLPMSCTSLWEELAWIQFDQNDLSQADKSFAKSIALDPYLIQRQFSRAEVLVRLNRNDDAREVMLKLKKQFPDDNEVAEQFGWFCLRRGELDSAEKEFDSIITRDAKNVLGINGMAGYHLEQRDYRAAEKALREAIKLVDFEPQYHINLAWSLIRQVREPGETPKPILGRRAKLLEEAAASCRRALELEPQNAKAFVCLGVIAFKRNLLLDAEGYFSKSLDLSAVEGAHVELGALYIQMGRYEEARKELCEAIKLNKNDARAHIELANLLLLEENDREAVRECLQAVGADQNNDEAHRALSIALMRAGNYDEAEKALRVALKRIDPAKQWQLHLMLSRILVRLADDNDKDRGLYGEALKHINEARKTHPNADVYFHAGIVHSKLGEYRLARGSFGQCLKENRDHFDAERYRKLVESFIRQERTISKGNTWGGWALAAFCVIALIGLWTVYLRGSTITIPASEPGTTTQNGSPPPANPQSSSTAAGNTQTTSAQTANQQPALQKPKQEPTVDKSLITMMTPLLLGLTVIGLLLPNLNKIKLPGGIEAEIREVKTPAAISSGPKGDISFGSSLPTVSPGPGGRN